jgi:hypothetical protein
MSFTRVFAFLLVCVATGVTARRHLKANGGSHLRTHETGLLASYSFSGNALDSSGNGLHGTLSSAVANATDRFNIPNSAYSFSGSGGVTINGTTLNNVVTLSFWINPSSTQTSPSCSNKVFNKQGSWSFEVDSCSATQYGFMGCSAGDFSYCRPLSSEDPLLLPTETWTHVTFVISRSAYTWKYYKNGVYVRTLSPIIITVSNNNALTIGSSFHGLLDDVALYSRVLSDAEISGLFGGYTSPPTYLPTPRPTSWYTGGDSTPCNDASKFSAVFYNNFEIDFLTTVPDTTAYETYTVVNTGTIRLTTGGWLVHYTDTNSPLDVASKCTVSSLTLQTINGGICSPPANTNDPSASYYCPLYTNSDRFWGYVVPTTYLPSTIEFNVNTYELDGSPPVKDAGSDVLWTLTYQNPDQVDQLQLNTAVPRYFTRTSSDGRKQRLRYLQTLMCFDRDEFSNNICNYL